MSVSHLAKLNPSLLSFLRAFLWQLLRTGQIAETNAEHQSAVDTARVIFSLARDRDHLWRLFGEYRQWVEQGESAVISDTLRGALATAPAADHAATGAEPTPAETAAAPTEPVSTPSVNAVEEAPVSTPSVNAIEEAPVSMPSVNAVEEAPVSTPSIDAAPTETVSQPEAAPSPAREEHVAQPPPASDGQDDAMSTAGDGPDGDGADASDGPSAQVVRGAEPDTESGEDHNG